MIKIGVSFLILIVMLFSLPAPSGTAATSRRRFRGPAGRLRLDDRKIRRPGRARAGRKPGPRRRPGQPRAQRRFAGPRRAGPSPRLSRSDGTNGRGHRFLRHRRSQRRSAQERSARRKMVGPSDRDRQGHGCQDHSRPVFRQRRSEERPGGARRGGRGPEKARPRGRKGRRRPGPRELAQRRRELEDPRAGRLAGRPGLLRRRQFPGRRTSHLRRDPPAGGAHRGVPRQGHQGPVRQGLHGFPGRPQGDGGHRVRRLARHRGHQDAAGGRGKRPLRHRLPEDGLPGSQSHVRLGPHRRGVFREAGSIGPCFP